MAEIELERLTDIDVLLSVKKEIRDRICHAVLQHEKNNNKAICMKLYNLKK